MIISATYSVSKRNDAMSKNTGSGDQGKHLLGSECQFETKINRQFKIRRGHVRTRFLQNPGPLKGNVDFW